MKKYVSLLLVFVILLFAACSPAQSPESEPTTSTTAATEPSGTDVLTEPSEPNVTEPSEPSEEATQPSTNPPSEPSDPTVEPTEPPTDPSEPSEPTEPTIKPTEPTKPTQPTEPTTKPSNPGGNSSTGGGTDDKEKPSQPTEPSEEDIEKPTEPSEPKPETDYILKVSPTTMTLEVGKTGNISYEYTGTGTLTWRSSNDSIATVSNGKVTAKAAGTAAITLSDGKKQAQCIVTVKPKPVTASLTINTPKNTIVFVGETLKLDYTYTGTGKLTFESYDTSRLTIDSNGKMTGISEGGVYVGVTDGNLLKSVRIVVKGVKATSIKMSGMEGPLFDGVTKYVGDYMSFIAKSRPTGTSYLVKASSSNSSVVSVSTKTINGDETEITLKYKAAGSATITLTSEDGCVVYKYKVNVKSEYSCYPGKEKLTPEEFADACTQVMVANGFKKDTGCTSYRVLTINANQLTWSNAKAFAQGYVRSWYPNGKDSCWISYEGTDEKGNYIFYTRWG